MSPWTKAEDGLLRAAVQAYGDKDDWKLVAQMVPGRTNKACRKRWLHSLSPNLKKTAWTPDEDKLLLSLYAIHGTHWAQIARHIPGRTDDSCSRRFKESLDPSLKRDDWTSDEDARLIAIYGRFGGRWKDVGQELGRSSLSCRNRIRALERRQSHVVQLQPQIESPECLYYPPEAYPMNLNQGQSSHSFREPTPEPIPRSSPYIAPFKFSSSSLSAALSDPPRIPQSLPPESPADDFSSPDLFSSISTLPSDSYDDFGDGHMQLDASAFQSSPLIFAGDPPFSPNISLDNFSSHFSFPCSTGPQKASDFDRLSTFQYNSTLHAFTPTYDDLSSTSSSPFLRVNSLSPAASPNGSLSVELPFVEQFSDSLLFSQDLPDSQPSSQSQSESQQSYRLSQSEGHSQHHPGQPSPQPRSKPALQRPSNGSKSDLKLSSNMPVTADDSIKAYACGYCYHDGQHTAFRTSKDLYDHTKDRHKDEEVEKPFRCGLKGCNKAWKSNNGLQYHLQVSTEHFTRALSTRFSAQQKNLAPRKDDSGSVSDPEQNSSRTYACPKPHCFKAYRNGHPKHLPVQLAEVPPTLEAKIPARTKKMRAKHVLGTESS